jgi:hypothetical protein
MILFFILFAADECNPNCYEKFDQEPPIFHFEHKRAKT